VPVYADDHAAACADVGLGGGRRRRRRPARRLRSSDEARKRAKVKQGEVTEAPGGHRMLPPQQQLPKTIEEIEGEIAQQLDIEAQNNGSDRRVPVMAKRLTGVVAKDPEAAARLVRSWLVDEKKAS
jgi:flagellar biosynthesis/type III secretory pathway M-ring protein FliF/YscJ